MNAKPVNGKQKAQFHGVLGHQALSLCSAVIDDSTHTLYMRQPLRALWPQVEGKWGVHVRPDGVTQMLALFDPKTELDEKCESNSVGPLMLANGKFTVCLAADLTQAKAIPTEFAVAKGSGLILLEFQRGKPEKK
ncbi:MAG: hypothetical protein MUF18_20600 [Fimbriiglobus sp.]|nr:hypothetical protein [Fimbriiglobus sp.]